LAYISDDSNEARADRMIDVIFERLAMLATHPRAGRQRQEFGEDVRSFSVAGHVIYYREDDGQLVVARVLHGNRDQIAAWNEPIEGGDR
jgi:plasmid stabilization system protein ParE